MIKFNEQSKKLIFWVLIISSSILILTFGLFTFVARKNVSTELNKKENTPLQMVVETEKTTPEFEKGKKLFSVDCNICHPKNSIVNTWRMKTGIMEEMGIDYFKKYITHQDSLINANDIYALKLKEEYGNLANSHNFDYSQTELIELIEYIKTEQ